MGGAPSVAGVSPEWGTEGFHVLQTQQGSPGDAAGLEPYFDFIVAVNDRRLDKDDDTLRTILKQQCNQTVTLYVYSTKYKRIRSVTVVPSESWGGPGLLGVSIRFCSFAEANEAVWHVTDVLPGSPAQAAGLISNSDYIIGSDVTLAASKDLLTLIEVSDRHPIKLYVYNSSTDSTREVILVPDSSWPGEGSIGCQICSGYLHQIPVPSGGNVHDAIVRVQEKGPAPNCRAAKRSSVGFDAVFTELRGENGQQCGEETAVCRESTGEANKPALMDPIGLLRSSPPSLPIFHPDQDLTTLRPTPPSHDNTLSPQTHEERAFPFQHPAHKAYPNLGVPLGGNVFATVPESATSTGFEAEVLQAPSASQNTPSFYGTPVQSVSTSSGEQHQPSPDTSTAYSQPNNQSAFNADVSRSPRNQSYPSGLQPPSYAQWSPTTPASAFPIMTTTVPPMTGTTTPSVGMPWLPQASALPRASSETCPAWMTISVPPNLHQQ